MKKLEVDQNRYPDPDAAYHLIVEAHRGLSEAESARLNARLVLVMANQLGDIEMLKQALAVARVEGGAKKG